MMKPPLLSLEVGTLVRNIRGQAKGNICFSYNGPGTAKRLTEVELYLLGIPAWMIYAVACALYHFYKTNISEFGNKSSCQDFDH